MIPFSASRRGLRRSNSSFSKRGMLDQLSRMRANSTLVLVQSASRIASLSRTGTSPLTLTQMAERAEMVFNLTGANTLTVTDAAERQKFAALTADSPITLVQEADVEKITSGLQSTFSVDMGASDYIDFTGAGATAPNNQAFSISWWEKVKSGSGTYPIRFLLASSVDLVFLARSSDPNYATFWKTSFTTGANVKFASAPSLASSVDVWRHWVFIMKTGPNSGTGTDYVLYVDNTLYTQSSNPGGSNAANDKNWIGIDPSVFSLDSNYDANCLFDDIRIYHKELTAQEVEDLFMNTNPNDADLEWYFPLEEGSGTTTNETIQNDDGTLVNGPTWSSDVPAALA